MRYFLIVSILFIFTACSTKKSSYKNENLYDSIEKVTFNSLKNIPIYDLLHIPQDVNHYTKNINHSHLFDLQKSYEESYFFIWNINKPEVTLKEIQWPFDVYKLGKSYGENLQLLEQSFFDDMLEQFNLNQYATLNKKAITIKHLDIRAFPTNKPLFRDPSKAGEGFPFDYLQNSTVQANKPILVSHYSKDKKWVFIFTSFAYGWVLSDEIVYLDEQYTDIWQKAKQIHIIKENVPLYSTSGEFLFYSKVGMLFALIDEDDTNYTVLTTLATKNQKPLFLKSKLSKEIARKDIMMFNDNNLVRIIKEVSKTNYCWGGMYEQRDCSSTIRDIFAPFGIWLPRNSYQQAKIGKVINIEGLNDAEKIAFIKEKAIPFQTLLYKKGHILLYVGTYDDEVIVFHNTWGIKTKVDGVEQRIVIGKTIFSTLKLGSEQIGYDEESELLRNIKSINILTKS